MADTITPKRRSEIMSHIRSKDTKIELMVRRYLFALGYRYRVNYKALPGKPDIVFTKKKIAIFMAVIGMDIIVGAGTLMPASQTRHTGGRRFNGHSSGIRSILLNLKLMGGK